MFRDTWVLMYQRELGPGTHEGTSNLSPCQKENRRKALSPLSPPSQHFSALGLSLLCVWAVIMAGCPSRKVWPRFTQWGGGQRVGWRAHLSPSPMGPILLNQNCSPPRRVSAGGSNPWAMPSLHLQPVPLQGKFFFFFKGHWDLLTGVWARQKLLNFLVRSQMWSWI